MSADRLREAAALMRERADAARYGPWTTCGAVVMAERSYGYEDVARCEGSAATEGNVINAFHIASWSPAVALAVADWLDSVHSDLSTYNATTTRAKHAFAVADAYLGGAK